MSMFATTPGHLPHQFGVDSRRRYMRGLNRQGAIRFAAEVLMSALNAAAYDDGERCIDQQITQDARFKVAVSVAVPLSMRGYVQRRDALMSIAGRAARLAREGESGGPAGRAIEAARLISLAAVHDRADVLDQVERAVELSLDAEVLAGCAHGQLAETVRAKAEARALRIANGHR